MVDRGVVRVWGRGHQRHCHPNRCRLDRCVSYRLVISSVMPKFRRQPRRNTDEIPALQHQRGTTRLNAEIISQTALGKSWTIMVPLILPGETTQPVSTALDQDRVKLRSNDAMKNDTVKISPKCLNAHEDLQAASLSTTPPPLIPFEHPDRRGVETAHKTHPPASHRLRSASLNPYTNVPSVLASMGKMGG